MTLVWKTIPGETPIDISGLKISRVNNRQELSVVDAENVRKAIVKYLGGSLTRRTAKFDLSDRSPPSGLPRWFTGFCATENRYLFRGSAKTGEPLGQAQWGSVGNVKFDLSWMLKLHREMFGDVWKWAGEARTTDLNFGSPWYQVSAELHDLCADLADWEKHWPDVVEQTAHLHHRAVQIHPFLNGNGRWSRLLANIWLKLHKLPLTEWPEDAIGATSKIRDDYLAAIRAADSRDFAPLIDLHRQFAAES